MTLSDARTKGGNEMSSTLGRDDEIDLDAIEYVWTPGPDEPASEASLHDVNEVLALIREVRRLRAAVARVEALCDWAESPTFSRPSGAPVYPHAIRAALDHSLYPHGIHATLDNP